MSGNQKGCLSEFPDTSAATSLHVFVLLIRPDCFKHSDRIQQTNLRPGNKTTGFRYWIKNKCQSIAFTNTNRAHRKMGRTIQMETVSLDFKGTEEPCLDAEKPDFRHLKDPLGTLINIYKSSRGNAKCVLLFLK